MKIPAELKYSQDHEWTRSGEDAVRIGISDYAQDQRGDIIFVDLPQVGDSLEKGDEFGSIESVKAVSDLFMPIGGEIVSINEELEDAPELVNESPYGKGWIIEVKPDDPAELDSLMNKGAYL